MTLKTFSKPPLILNLNGFQQRCKMFNYKQPLLKSPDKYIKAKTKSKDNCSRWSALKQKQIFNLFSQITSDQKRRHRFAKQELRTLILKSLLTSSILRSNELKLYPKLKKNSYKPFNKSCFICFSRLISMPSINRQFRKIKAITRIRNRCVFSAHPTALAKLGLSRITFRNFAGFGKIPGLVKI